jgi:hypothetical protein
MRNADRRDAAEYGISEKVRSRRSLEHPLCAGHSKEKMIGANSNRWLFAHFRLHDLYGELIPCAPVYSY